MRSNCQTVSTTPAQLEPRGLLSGMLPLAMQIRLNMKAVWQEKAQMRLHCEFVQVNPCLMVKDYCYVCAGGKKPISPEPHPRYSQPSLSDRVLHLMSMAETTQRAGAGSRAADFAPQSLVARRCATCWPSSQWPCMLKIVGCLVQESSRDSSART